MDGCIDLLSIALYLTINRNKICKEHTSDCLKAPSQPSKMLQQLKGGEGREGGGREERGGGKGGEEGGGKEGGGGGEVESTINFKSVKKI